MKPLRLTLGTKITGTVLLVVLCFGGFVLLTNGMVSGVSREIGASTAGVEQSNQQAAEVLEEVAAANQFDRKVVTMLTTQLRMNQLNKLYLATEDAVVQMDHDELTDAMAALIKELGTGDERIAALQEPFNSYRDNFLAMDDRILEQELDKARQISVTALDTDSGAVVDTLQQILDESSATLAEHIRSAADASQASAASVGALQELGAQLQGTIRTLSMVAGLLILVCFGVAVLVPRAIVRNLLKVVGAMREMAAGDFTNNLEVRARDEVGELGNELNKMMEQLRAMIRSVVTVSVELASASEELSATTTQIAAGSEQMGSQTQGVASAAAQMAATVSEIARGAQSVSEVSEGARASAAEGGQVISEALGAFARIEKVVASAAELVDTLGSQSKQIGVVVEVIEDIADQTNLLALNAAIEAARAGEHGRGFAVVADEVRKLAEKTVKATQEIGATVQAIQADAASAVEAMREGQEAVAGGSERAGRAGDAVEEMESGIARTSEQVSQIATGTEQLSVTIQDLAKNMEEIAGGVAHTVEATVEISNTAATMSTQAEELRGQAGKFTV
jgi:methyl-accepting chemotaxis protein